MGLQDILNAIQGHGQQQGLRPTGMFGPNPLQSFGNRPSAPNGQFPTNPFPQQGGPQHTMGTGSVLGPIAGGMGSGGK